MNIYLIGYRCTGKTTVANQMARLTGWKAVDADVQLVEEQGRTIAQIVADQGWESFRHMEKKVLEHLSELDNHIVATGGGVILDPENIKIMRKTGKVVWLRATPETIQSRMQKDESTNDSRPSLTAKGLFDEIMETLSQREPLYRKATDAEITTDDVDIPAICRRIIELYLPV